MQIAAMRPQYLTRDEVPADVVAKEREIAEATSREEGKPEQAIAKITEGRLNGFFKDVVLLEQPSVTENKKSVKAVLDDGRHHREAVRPLRGRRLTGLGCSQTHDEEAGSMTGSTDHRTGLLASSTRDRHPVRRSRRVTGYKRVLLKLSGEVFGGGKVGVDPDVVQTIAREIADVVRGRRPDRDRHRRRQLLPRRRAPAARHGPGPRRLHGHARHRHELPGAPGLPREAGRRDPRPDRDHDGPGRRALHPAARDPAHGEGPRRHLRRRRGHAVLLHRHRRRPARAGEQVRRRPDGQERRRRRLQRRPARSTRPRPSSTSSPTTRRSPRACGSWTRRRSRCAARTSCR